MVAIISLAYTITPKTYAGSYAKAASAMKWALNIANDNSYTYGYGKGKCPICYGYKDKDLKQFVCTKFITAAYAHGAKDSEMQKWCKKGSKPKVKDLKKAMKKSKRWKYLGKPKCKNMVGGEVVFYGNSHVEMYFGNNSTIGAHGKDGYSKKNSISVRKMKSGYTEVYKYVG